MSRKTLGAMALIVALVAIGVLIQNDDSVTPTNEDGAVDLVADPSDEEEDELPVPELECKKADSVFTRRHNTVLRDSSFMFDRMFYVKSPHFPQERGSDGYPRKAVWFVAGVPAIGNQIAAWSSEIDPSGKTDATGFTMPMNRAARKASVLGIDNQMTVIVPLKSDPALAEVLICARLSLGDE